MADHERKMGPPGPLNWLDWQCPDGLCPKCGNETEWFKGGPLGQLLDGIPDADQYGAPVPGSGIEVRVRQTGTDDE